ncbi:MAG: hypothetical protein WA159_18945 [Variovorax sp.]
MLTLDGLARDVVARWERGDLAEAVRALDQRLQAIAEDRVRHLDLIERAIGLYGDDDVDIDAHDTLLCESEGGAFVMGWLWVPGPDGDTARRTDPSSTD